MVIGHKTQDLYRFRPSAWRKTLHPMLCCTVLIEDEIDCVLQETPASPYILWRRRVIGKVFYLVQLQYLVQPIILRCTPWFCEPGHLRWCGPYTILWYRGFIPPHHASLTVFLLPNICHISFRTDRNSAPIACRSSEHFTLSPGSITYQISMASKLHCINIARSE
jgi:hypothetical protein